MDVYSRAGVPHLWLLEPAQETVEVYELHSQYELIARHAIGDVFTCPLFPGEEICVEVLFNTQSKRWPQDDEKGGAGMDNYGTAQTPIPDWLLPPETKIGLEYFFHLGHPERRWEFWDNKARSVLAFGSAAEARARLDHFVTEACHWESLPRPRISQLSDEVDQTEAGRFQLTRSGRLVFLDVAIDGRRHHEILTRWTNRAAWDWGEEPISQH